MGNGQYWIACVGYRREAELDRQSSTCELRLAPAMAIHSATCSSQFLLFAQVWFIGQPLLRHIDVPLLVTVFQVTFTNLSILGWITEWKQVLHVCDILCSLVIPTVIATVVSSHFSAAMPCIAAYPGPDRSSSSAINIIGVGGRC